MTFPQDTQHDTSKMLGLPRKMTTEISKMLRLSRQLQLGSCENDTKVLRLLHKTTFDALSNRLECHTAPLLPRKTT